MKRVACIDYLKAFGIVCVVFGHTQMPDLLLRWVYSFHMPLFFFVSGFLLSRENIDLPFKSFVRRKLLKLVGAYVVFAVVGSVVAVLISQGSSRFRAPLGETVISRVLSILYASGSIEGRLALTPGVLWFFPALITSFVFVYAPVRCRQKLHRNLHGFGVLAVLIFFTLLAFLLSGWHLPWQMESGFAAALIVYSGHVCRANDALKKCVAVPVIVTVPLLLIGWFLASMNPRMYFYDSIFGNPLLAYPSFVFTIVGLVIFFSKLPSSKFISIVSEATLVIFPLHMLVLLVLNILALHGLQLSTDIIQNSQAYAVCVGTITIVLLLVAFHYWTRFSINVAPARS